MGWKDGRGIRDWARDRDKRKDCLRNLGSRSWYGFDGRGLALSTMGSEHKEKLSGVVALVVFVAGVLAFVMGG